MEALEILQQSDLRFGVLILKQHLMPPLLQSHVVVVGHAIVPDNREPFCQQQLTQMEPNKAGTPGHEHLLHHRLQSAAWPSRPFQIREPSPVERVACEAPGHPLRRIPYSELQEKRGRKCDSAHLDRAAGYIRAVLRLDRHAGREQ
jgi:hypothetical protein